MSGGLYRYETQCGGKLPHRSKSQALAHVRNMRRKRMAGSEHLEVYRCPWCSRWHAGRKPGVNHALMTGGRTR